MVVGERLADRLEPVMANWWATADYRNGYYGPPLRLAETARRFDISPAWFSWVGAAPALEVLLEIGVDEINEHNVRLANRFRARWGSRRPTARSSPSRRTAPRIGSRRRVFARPCGQATRGSRSTSTTRRMTSSWRLPRFGDRRQGTGSDSTAPLTVRPGCGPPPITHTPPEGDDAETVPRGGEVGQRRPGTGAGPQRPDGAIRPGRRLTADRHDAANDRGRARAAAGRGGRASSSSGSASGRTPPRCRGSCRGPRAGRRPRRPVRPARSRRGARAGVGPGGCAIASSGGRGRARGWRAPSVFARRRPRRGRPRSQRRRPRRAPPGATGCGASCDRRRGTRCGVRPIGPVAAEDHDSAAPRGSGGVVDRHREIGAARPGVACGVVDVDPPRVGATREEAPATTIRFPSGAAATSVRGSGSGLPLTHAAVAAATAATAGISVVPTSGAAPRSRDRASRSGRSGRRPR